MIVYRKLLATELPDYCAHLLRLDANDRRARFLAPTDDGAIARHVDGLDPATTIILGGFINGVMRGAVELVGDPKAAAPKSGMDAVELAVSIERPFQNTGAGSQLVRHAVELAQTRGIQRINMLCLRQNKRMQAICKKLNGLLDYDEADVMCDIKVARPARAAEEAANAGIAAADRKSQWGRREPEPIGDRPAAAALPPAAAGLPRTAIQRTAVGPCRPA